jgi:hypothetical protein
MSSEVMTLPKKKKKREKKGEEKFEHIDGGIDCGSDTNRCFSSALGAL